MTLTHLERAVLENARDGRDLCHGIPVGKELGRAQHVMVDLRERGWIDEAFTDDPIAAPFVLTPAGRVALER